MKTTWILFCAFLLFEAGLAAYNARSRYSAEDDDFQHDLSVRKTTAAYLLVDKRILNKVIVESMDIIVRYYIYNIGTLAASDVRLQDPSFDDASKFMVVGGLTDVVLGSIPTGKNVSHAIVVRPLQSGPYEFAPAEITYRSGDDTVFGSSSVPGNAVIQSTNAFQRKFSPHFEEWTVFAILAMPSLLIPFILWHSSKTQYEKLAQEFGGSGRKRRMPNLTIHYD